MIQTMMAGENQIATAGGSGVVDADSAGADRSPAAGTADARLHISSFNQILRLNQFKICAAFYWASTRFGSSTDYPMR